jgi:hypothetical protein
MVTRGSEVSTRSGAWAEGGNTIPGGVTLLSRAPGRMSWHDAANERGCRLRITWIRKHSRSAGMRRPHSTVSEEASPVRHLARLLTGIPCQGAAKKHCCTLRPRSVHQCRHEMAAQDSVVASLKALFTEAWNQQFCSTFDSIM